MGDSLTPTHLIFVSIIALLIFGPRRIPMIGRSFSKGIREFKTTVIGMDSDRDGSEMTAQSPSGESARLS